MDPATIAGLLVALASIVVSMAMDGSSAAALISPSSFVLVFFGSIGATIGGYRFRDLLRVPKAMMVALTGRVPDADRVVTTVMEMADLARREGMLAMEERLEDIDDRFLQTGLQAVVDGLDQEAVAAVLDAEITSVDDRHQVLISFFRGLGGYAPTMGMVGTVIGLVNMLGNLTDPSQLGSGMSLALLTTLYGVLFANLFFMPLASRLTRLHESEMAVREMVRDGILGIQAGLSLRVLVDRLECYLLPSQRVGHRSRAERKAPRPEEEVAA